MNPRFHLASIFAALASFAGVAQASAQATLKKAAAAVTSIGPSKDLHPPKTQTYSVTKGSSIGRAYNKTRRERREHTTMQRKLRKAAKARGARHVS